MTVSDSKSRLSATVTNYQRATRKDHAGDLSGQFEKAESEAIAADMAGQEANAARLKAVLDAARKEAADKTNAPAEQRSSDPPASSAQRSGDWQAIIAERFIDPNQTDIVLADWPSIGIELIRSKDLMRRVIPVCVAALLVIAAAAYFYLDDTPSTTGQGPAADRASHGADRRVDSTPDIVPAASASAGLTETGEPGTETPENGISGVKAAAAVEEAVPAPEPLLLEAIPPVPTIEGMDDAAGRPTQGRKPSAARASASPMTRDRRAAPKAVE